MRRFAITVVALTLAGSAALAAAGVGARAAGCGSLTLGPGSLTHHSGSGASCLLRAYQQHCLPASYRLSLFGVDTVAVRTFRTLRHGGSCEIAVTSSFRVIPQPPHPAIRGYCKTLRREGHNVVAQGCSGGGLPTRVSLTSTQ
jgi:hypothetical protein